MVLLVSDGPDHFDRHFDWLAELGYTRIHDEETRYGVYESATTRIALFHAERDEAGRDRRGLRRPGWVAAAA